MCTMKVYNESLNGVELIKIQMQKKKRKLRQRQTYNKKFL